jgi:pilus assembly protein CpaC
MNKVPGIGDLPVLGQLFRSKNLNHSVTELVILVTAAVVDPLSPNAKPAGQPNFVVPNLDPESFDRSVQGAARLQPPVQTSPEMRVDHP